jgi:hypothetical protein
MADRLRFYVRTARAVSGLEPEDLVVGLIPTRSGAAAHAAEDVLLEAYDPVMNRRECSGWGSRRQGPLRERGQRPSPATGLFQHPNKSEPTAMARASVALFVAGFVADPSRTEPTWH